MSDNVSTQVKALMDVLPSFVGDKTDMRAYLVMMCARLVVDCTPMTRQIRLGESGGIGH